MNIKKRELYSHWPLILSRTVSRKCPTTTGRQSKQEVQIIINKKNIAYPFLKKAAMLAITAMTLLSPDTLPKM
uniref:Uncharacterized protein n=1 Tax=Setaria italica TaxID=4555 RepID=K3ZYR0_SETIT